MWEKPRATRTYTISNLRSSCGTGDIKNSYTLIVRVPLGVQLPAELISLKAYPNPTSGDISVEWSSPVRQEINLQIINSEGKIIKQVFRHSTVVSQTELFQISGQPTGLYLLRVTTPQNGVLVKSILKL